jgi:hypothetical protein
MPARGGKIHRMGLSPSTSEYSVEGKIVKRDIEFHAGKPNSINKLNAQEMFAGTDRGSPAVGN